MYNLPQKNMRALKAISAIALFFVVVTCLLLCFHIIYIRTPVNGPSMYPTLNKYCTSKETRDIVYINRFSNGKRGDVVVLDLTKHPSFEEYAIKRLVAIENDVVNIAFNSQTREYELIVNNAVVDTRASQGQEYSTYSYFQKYIANNLNDSSRIVKNELNQVVGIKIKQGEVFVLGDNWNNSKDSALFGPMRNKDVVGKVDFIIHPHQNEFWQLLKGIF